MTTPRFYAGQPDYIEQLNAMNDITEAVANYKGVWSELTGAYIAGAAVYHLGTIWVLTENVADITGEIPGMSTKWDLLSSGEMSIPNHDEEILDETDPGYVITTYKLLTLMVAIKTIIITGAVTVTKIYYAAVYLLAELISDLVLATGTGAVTLARASTQYVTDNDGKTVAVSSGVPCFPGLRPVTNPIIYSENFNAWSKNPGVAVTQISGAEWSLNLTGCADNEGIYKSNCITNIGSFGDYALAVEMKVMALSGTNQVRLRDNTGIDGIIADKTVILTTAWQRVVVQGQNKITNRNRGFKIAKATGGANVIRVRYPQGEASAIVGEYIPTVAAAVTQWFPHYHSKTPLSVWGDSMTASDKGYGLYLRDKLLNCSILDGGVGGEASTEIKDRFLATTSQYGNVTILEMGRNDLRSDNALVLANIAACVAALTTSNFAIVSIFNGGAFYTDEVAGGTDYVLIMELNDALFAAYPDNYIELRRHIVSLYDPALPQDVIDFGNDQTPASLRTDNLHLNAAGNSAASTYLSNWLIAKGWVSTPSTEIAITGTKGVLISPSSTNKFAGYGVPPADKTAYGPTYTAGQTLRKGSVCEIVTRATLDFGTVGTLQSGTANTAGAQYLITGAALLGAGDSAKQDLGAVGTKSYYVDGAFVQNMRNTADAVVLTLSGDVAGVLSITLNRDAIEDAGLARVSKNHKDYYLDCTAGSGSVYAMADSATYGNTNPHSLSILGSGNAYGTSLADSAALNSVAVTADYGRYKSEGIIPIVTTRKLRIAANAGLVLHFMAPCLEELPFASDIMVSDGSAFTRAADIMSLPITANVPDSGGRRLLIQWTPLAVVSGRAEVIAYSGASAANCIKVISTGTSIYLEKIVGGVSKAASLAIVPIAGMQYSIDCGFNYNNTMFLSVNGTPAGTNTGTNAAPVFGDDLYIGSDGTNASFAQFTEIQITN